MGQIQILKTEIDNDPLTRGYAGMTDREVAVSLNLKTRSKSVTRMTGVQLGDAVDETEYKALSDVNKAAVRELVQVPQLNPFGFAAIVIKDIFPNQGSTIAALIAMRTTTTSRAKELGAREFVQAEHVTKARAL